MSTWMCIWRAQMFARKSWWNGDSKVQKWQCWTYLQVHIKKSLWQFHTVEIREQRYYLTCLGFRLNVTLLIMWSIVNTFMKQDKIVNAATSSYINDIFVIESVYSAVHVKKHLEQFGLTSKISEQLRHGTHVLGLRFWEEQGKLWWRGGGELPMVPSVLTGRVIFSGKCSVNFPHKVCGWLHVATAFVKQRVNALTIGWDDEINPGGKRTQYFVKLVNPRVPRAAVQVVVRECQSIDPAPVHWKPGKFKVSENWSRVEIDVTHFRN